METFSPLPPSCKRVLWTLQFLQCVRFIALHSIIVPCNMKRQLFIFSVGMYCLLPTAFAQEHAAPAKVARYATVIIQRYDSNGDGILQREEWEKMPGTPQAIDLNGDGQITKDELIWYLTHYGKTRTIHRTIIPNLSEPYKFDPANLRLLRPVVPRAAAPPVVESEPQESETEGVEEVMKANEELIDDDIYQKMLEERRVPAARPYHVLPESLRGVPRWFIMLDKNGDGQISLAEFAPTLAPRALMLFKQLDKNNNGFIEPDEARNP